MGEYLSAIPKCSSCREITYRPIQIGEYLYCATCAPGDDVTVDNGRVRRPTITPKRIDPKSIPDHRAGGWPDFHPEDFCHRCGDRNPNWFAPKDVWDVVSKEWLGVSTDAGICCPTCAAELFQAATGESWIWELSNWVDDEATPWSDVVERARAAMEDYSRAVSADEAVGEAINGANIAGDALAVVVPGLVAEVERLHSWGGLMSLLDEHYPEDIFPTEEDRDTRDPGPRIISLLRTVDRLKRQLEETRLALGWEQS